MNVLITGSNGQLGRKFKECINNPSFTPFFTDSKTLDITDEESVKRYVIDNEIDVILNCAAYTNVDKAEEEQDKAKLINADACRYLADAIKQRDGYLIHISTDYVFDGSNPTPKSPNDIILGYDQTTWYGKTKRTGECLIESSGCHYLIFRTAWLYSNVGKNFVKTIYNRLREGKDSRVVYDQVGSPTNAEEFAQFLYEIINNKLYKGNDGIYHFTNLGVASWYDLAKEVAYAMGDGADQIIPCLSDEYPTPAKRPKYSVLDVSKTIETFKFESTHWMEAVYITVEELEREYYENKK